MTVRALTEAELISVYENHLVFDFPPAEVKPLSRILELFHAGSGEGRGLFDESGRLLAYALLAETADAAFLDYLAVVSAARNAGLGSRFLMGLLAELPEGTPLLLEAEDPQDAASEEEKHTRTRRLGFYRRCGVLPTEVRSSVFGVRYRILASGPPLPTERVRAALGSVYALLFPEAHIADWTAEQRPRIF